MVRFRLDETPCLEKCHKMMEDDILFWPLHVHLHMQHTHAGTHVHAHTCAYAVHIQSMKHVTVTLLSSFHTSTITCGPHILLETAFLSVALYFCLLFKGRNFEQQIKLVTWKERIPATLLKTHWLTCMAQFISPHNSYSSKQSHNEIHIPVILLERVWKILLCITLLLAFI